MIIWQKKVIRNSDNALLYNGSGMFAGSGFGGTNGAFSVVIPATLSMPANDVTVFENFLLFVAADQSRLYGQGCCWWSRTGCLSLPA
jgi:hypothetical protein